MHWKGYEDLGEKALPVPSLEQKCSADSLAVKVIGFSVKKPEVFAKIFKTEAQTSNGGREPFCRRKTGLECKPDGRAKVIRK